RWTGLTGRSLKLLSRRLFATRMERPFQVVLVLTSSTVLRPVEQFLQLVESENRSAGMRTRTGRIASARHRPGATPDPSGRRPIRPGRRPIRPGDAPPVGRGARVAGTEATGWPGRRRSGQSVTSTTPWAPRSASTIEWLTKG